MLRIYYQTRNKKIQNRIDEVTKICLARQKYISDCETKIVILETQQKEFISYLEDKIYSIEPKGTSINYNCEYDSEEDYINAMKEQSRLNSLKEILNKYKEIIGVSDETNKQ